MSIQEIFIKENDNLIYKLIDLGIDFKEKEKDLRSISEKIYNNQVGYLQFKDKNENILKIYVLPKIFKKPQSEQEKKETRENFSKYMHLAFSLVDKYQSKLNIKEFKHIETFLDQYKKALKRAELINFEELLYLKYELALKQTFRFFQKHQAYIIEEKTYFSQTLKHKINLKKNIKEINKTKIHQIKKETLIYSQLAYISYQVLNSFEEKILKIFDEKIKEKLHYILTKTKNLLKRKYKTHTIKKANVKEILSNKTKNLFKKSEDKKLYSYLLTLLGTEIIEGEKKDIYISPKVLTFFISPEKVYEIFIYDQLKYKLKKIEYQNKKSFYIESNNKNIKKDSKPDIVIYKKNKLILIDCKWKIIENIGNINMDDILKLERDTKVWYQKNIHIVPILIYPIIKIKERKFNIKYSNKDFFKFYIFEYNLILN